MSSLSANEIELLNRFFNKGGYVFDFSTDDFDDFTLRSIGIPLCEKFGLSKGKSLRKFFQDNEDKLVRSLLLDLLEYYESFILPNETQRGIDSFIDCQEIADSLQMKSASGKSNDNSLPNFNTEYMISQIQTMQAAIESNPIDAIGKAKELLESCLITILNNEEIEIDKGWDLPRLSKETCKLLKLTPDDIPEERKASETIRRILGNLSSITTGIAELRNPHGSGHGKDVKYKGLSPRHACLAVGAATTAVQFIWETYQEQKQKGSIQ